MILLLKRILIILIHSRVSFSLFKNVKISLKKIRGSPSLERNIHRKEYIHQQHHQSCFLLRVGPVLISFPRESSTICRSLPKPALMEKHLKLL